MTDAAVSVERRGAVAIIRFDRQGRGNALSFPILDALAESAIAVSRDRSVSAVVLTGASTIYSSGMDLRQPVWDRIDELSIEDRHQLTTFGPRLTRSLGAIEVPLIAAVEGICFGGGLAMVAFCDFRVAAETARFAAPEVAVGLHMTWHSVPRLVRLVGAQATRRLLMLDTEWSANQALSLGFVDEVVPTSQAVDAALNMAKAIATRPRLATRFVKRGIEAATHGGDTLLSMPDSDLLLAMSIGDDFRKGRARLMDSKNVPKS
jgi:enoyl-CoA hydratase/carnithine racemase